MPWTKLRPMIYQFGQFELDLATAELRAEGRTLRIEPQVFGLLALLVENHGRLVSKEEIIEKVWDGRTVSDAAVASRVKSARQALGDDGKSQQFIRTIHRKGFRFVADVRVSRAPKTHLAMVASDSTAAGGTVVDQLLEQGSRPSLAVLPFRLIGDGGNYAALAIALPGELITELSRLRWLFVTARGSSFRLRSPGYRVQRHRSPAPCAVLPVGHSRSVGPARYSHGRARRHCRRRHRVG